MTEQEDLPKIMASIAVTVPALAWKVGWAYLKAKKQRQRNAKYLTKGMVDGGMPPEIAHHLSEEFEAELSLRSLAGIFGSAVSRRPG